MKRFTSVSFVVVALAMLSMLVSSCSQTVGIDAPTSAPNQHMESQIGYSVQVSNNSSSEAVSFTFDLADNSQQFFGSAPQTSVTFPLNSSLVGVIANGVSIPSGVATVVAMSDGKKVTVTWTNGVIIVNDTLEMN
jgi:hypothetical protein